MSNKVTKRYHAIIVVVVVLTVLCVVIWIGRRVAIRHVGNLMNQWNVLVMRGHDADARRVANEIRLYDPRVSSMLFGELAVIDFMKSKNQLTMHELNNAAGSLESARFGILPAFDTKAKYILEASIRAMLGNDTGAYRYAIRGCVPTLLPDCLSRLHNDNRLLGLRVIALRDYEIATLYLAVVNRSSVIARFYQASALRFFNIDLSHNIIRVMQHNGTFTKNMRAYYCDRGFPTDNVICNYGEYRNKGSK